MRTNDYQITGVDSVKNGSNGYYFGIDYGEVKGKIITSENEEIEFGFINTNNWHNVQINIRIDSTSESKHVYQTIIYKTDGDYIDVIESDSIMENNRVSVFKNGV